MNLNLLFFFFYALNSSRFHLKKFFFKFLTLNERLSKINVDVAKLINRNAPAKPEETETHFYQALEKWVDLNYTASFCKQIKNQLISSLNYFEKIFSSFIRRVHCQSQTKLSNSCFVNLPQRKPN